MKGMPATPPLPEARLLVVYDDPQVRSSVARLLTLLGYSADVAGSGREALEMIRRAEYDAVILDIRMPGVDGVEVMRRAHVDHPALPIILLTGHASLESAIEAVRSKAADYLLKPASSHDLAVAISRALERDAPLERPGVGKEDERFLRVGCVQLDRQKRQVFVEGKGAVACRSAQLTPSETELLAHMMLRPGVICACGELAWAALAYDVDKTEARSIVRPHICRLRRKIEPDPDSPRLVRTAAGRGYVFSP